jgi:hypothetical protein
MQFEFFYSILFIVFIVLSTVVPRYKFLSYNADRGKNDFAGKNYYLQRAFLDPSMRASCNIISYGVSGEWGGF